MNQRPFIIWTLQRTGGTNLAQCLLERSGLQEVEHEPFNVGRVYGSITEDWMQSHDSRALRLAVESVVAKRELIKHCVELVPWKVTEVLAKVVCDSGYRHLFLYREKAVGRLLSLQFARMSGIWGPRLRDTKALDEMIFSEPLPVADLMAHEKASAKLLKKVWNYVLTKGGEPFALSFEELYQADGQEVMTRGVLSLLAYLELARNEQADREIVGSGSQGTRKKYASFKGVDKLQVALNKGDVFKPDNAKRAVSVFSRYENIAWIVHAAIDTLPSNVVVGQFYNITGVVVLDSFAPEGCCLVLRSGLESEKIEWGIESPWVAKRYPEAANRSHARFKSRSLRVIRDQEYQLCIIDGAENISVLFHITVDEVKIA